MRAELAFVVYNVALARPATDESEWEWKINTVKVKFDYLTLGIKQKKNTQAVGLWYKTTI